MYETSKFAVILSISIVFPVVAMAQCRPGETMTVTAVSNLSCTARWDGDCNEDAQWNPEPGWAIREARTHVHSSNNGNRSVSVIAGGSNFISERELQSAFDSANEYAASLPGQTGQQQNYSASLRSAFDRYLSQYRSTSATNNTVDARISAQGSGNIFNQTRGWETISVETDLVCVGAPGQVQEITQLLIQEANLPSRQSDSLNNNGSGNPPIPAAICYTSYGNCPMMVPIMQGSTCYCQSNFGPLWGTAQ